MPEAGAASQMRALTLDEKISLKGVFKFKGLVLPRLDMVQALRLWGAACGYNILRWHLFRNHGNDIRKRKPRRRSMSWRPNWKRAS